VKVPSLRKLTDLDDALHAPKHEAKIYSPGDVDAVSGAATARPDAHISEKVYLFPESYNYLRKMLYEEFPMLFQIVGHAMAFDAPRFIELMDAALDTKTTFDSDKVDSTCKKYIDLLRAKIGLSPLHATAAWSGAPRIVDATGKEI
jgi:hypothetical protein